MEEEMHIPDGFIPLWQCALYFLIALPFVIKSLSWARDELDEAGVPLFATLSAGIFAIQAMNIPIPWGTSGHMVGGVLTAILLGSPYAGVLLLMLVLLIQGFIFADGGITALGANVLNMGIIGTFTGYYVYAALRKRAGLGRASFAGAWAGMLISALAAALELAAAGAFPLAEGLLFMGLYHAVIGLVGEGLLTSVAVSTILKVSPELFPGLSREAAA